MWDLPGPGLEPVSPALAGGFLTTEPPGKSHCTFFFPTPVTHSHACSHLASRLPCSLGGVVNHRPPSLPGSRSGCSRLLSESCNPHPCFTHLGGFLYWRLWRGGLGPWPLAGHHRGTSIGPRVLSWPAVSAAMWGASPPPPLLPAADRNVPHPRVCVSGVGSGQPFLRPLLQKASYCNAVLLPDLCFYLIRHEHITTSWGIFLHYDFLLN